LYQYQGVNADFRGWEASTAFRVSDNIESEVSLESVTATNRTTGDPLPRIPPLQGEISLAYNCCRYSAEIGIRGAAAQHRTTRFEQSTDGFVVGDIWLQHTWPAHPGVHKITLAVHHVTNSVYRQHLSRVKAVMPEPGRNIRLGYSFYF